MSRHTAAPWPVDRLTFAAERLAAHSYAAGSFVVHWQTDQGGSLAIRHAARPERALWASPPAESFVGAAHGDEVYSGQHIEALSRQDDGLCIAGTLASASGGLVAYSMRLYGRTAKDLVFVLAVDGPCDSLVLSCARAAGERITSFDAVGAQHELPARRVIMTPAAQQAGRARAFYLTSRLRALYLEGNTHTTFDLRAPERLRICVRARQMTGHILYGVAYDDVRATYAASTATALAPPLTRPALRQGRASAQLAP